MILTALNQYYDRLVSEPDPDTGRLRVPGFGFSEEKIGYVLVISAEGKLVDVINHMDSSGRKIQPKKMAVPRPEKRTSGIQPNFLWDKSAYVLGVQANPDKKAGKEVPWVKSEKTFYAFKQRHIEVLESCNDEGLSALVNFLQQWQFEHIDESPCHHDMLHTNLVFQLDGDHCYLHEREAIKKQWALLLESSTEVAKSHCLVTGKQEKIARLHPSIKGVFGGQSSGGSIVSFNAESYESYGKSQGENAPVSELAAFKYTTVLNYLLNRDNKHCLSVGDASTVFWAVAADGGKTEKAEQLFMQVVNPSDDSEAVKLNPWVEKISQGQPLKEIAPEIDPSTRFYLLGLAPNAARLSIRYWLDTSFGELAQHMAEHFTDLSLEPPAWNKSPSIFRLLIELVPHRAGQKSNAKDIPPHLAGEMMRSILTGDRYPHSLLAQLVLRLRTDGHISSLRIAMIKAVLQRNFRKLNKEGVPMGLDESYESNAYHTGRLFAVLERIQSSAIKGANATITDRYFGTASTVPYSVFPRLLAGSKNHLSKIRKNMPGYAVNLDKDITKIIAKLPPEFNKHFSIEDQGRFSIGYYHQREKYFSSGASASEQKNTKTN
ncbi:MAG: type I-C CRISPR-associated protein Cas8c/Csd1 [Gammaproteobacteria bacterium]|nr:type I-C CRISPR-associated protein Cas8c/Csd1 [Gammaproteobacteria bacterium]